MTSAPVPRSVRHVVPRRGYVLSCFTWTIRLGMIVEDILDLEVIGPPIVEPFDQQFADRRKTMRDPVSEAEGIADQLRQWRQSLPKHLEVDSSSAISPLPHHIVGLSVSEGLSGWHKAHGSGGRPRRYSCTRASCTAARRTAHP